MNTEVRRRSVYQAPDSHIQRTPSSSATGWRRTSLCRWSSCRLHGSPSWDVRDARVLSETETLELRGHDGIMPFWRTFFSPLEFTVAFDE